MDTCKQIPARINLSHVCQELSSACQYYGGIVEFQISRLNCDLLDVTQLYEQFSEPLGLWECKLAILHCANHYDAALVTNIWQNVINAEVKKLQVNDRLKCQ